MTRRPDFPRLDDAAMKARLAPPDGPVRVLIDTDAANEIDDQFALAWALLAPERLRIEAVTAAPFSFAHHRADLLEAEAALDAGAGADEPLRGGLQGWAARLHRQGRRARDVHFAGPEEGMELSHAEILRVFGKLAVAPGGRVHRGAPRYMADPASPVESPAVEAIIDHAKSGAPPLHIAAMGCVTNIASALLRAPEIVRDIVVVWTSAFPTHAPHSNRPSLNLVQDPHASRLIVESGVPHVYLPGYHVGAQLRLSLPEVERFVRGRGAIGDYLHHLFTHNPLHEMFALEDTGRRTWVIWDVINVAWLLSPDWVPSFLTRAPALDGELHWRRDEGSHLMREAHDVQRDEIFRDFYDRLAAAA